MKTVTTNLLKDKRAIAVEAMEAMHKKAKAAKGELSSEERQQWNNLTAEVQNYNVQIEEVGRQEDIDAEMAGIHGTHIGGNSTGAGAGTQGISLRSKNNHQATLFRSTDKMFNINQKRGLSFEDFAKAFVVGASNEEERSALAESADSTGGHLVPKVLANEFIQMFRPKMRVMQAGAHTIRLESNNLTMAKLTQDPTVAWRNENTVALETDIAFGKIEWKPKSIAAFIPASWELLQDAANIGSIIADSLSTAVAQEIDRTCLFGSGIDPQPRGIYNFPGTQFIDMGVNGASVADYSQLIKAYQLAMEANGDEPTAAIFSPRTWAAYAGLTASDGQPLQMPKAIEKLPMLVTSKMPNNLSHGTATDTSGIVLGDFTKLYIAIREDITLESSRHFYMNKLQTVFLIHARIDVAAVKENAFVIIEGVK